MYSTVFEHRRDRGLYFFANIAGLQVRNPSSMHVPLSHFSYTVNRKQAHYCIPARYLANICNNNTTHYVVAITVLYTVQNDGFNFEPMLAYN